jgi:hypothetical protein
MPEKRVSSTLDFIADDHTDRYQRPVGRGRTEVDPKEAAFLERKGWAVVMDNMGRTLVKMTDKGKSYHAEAQDAFFSL